MKKLIIGIIPTSNYMLTNDTFQDTYRYGNNYINKIVENGCIPYLIPLNNDQIIADTLSMCDGLIIPGGNRVTETNLKIVDYFYKNNKPILGICLGMQTLSIYSMKLDNKEDKILERIEGEVSHWPKDLLRENNEELSHYDYIKENTIMYDIFKTNKIEVNSVHNYKVNNVGSIFNISIESEYGIIEGIEYNKEDKFIIGVQFHPEILPQFNNLFAYFIKECEKRKKN